MGFPILEGRCFCRPMHRTHVFLGPCESCWLREPAVFASRAMCTELDFGVYF